MRWEVMKSFKWTTPVLFFIPLVLILCTAAPGAFGQDIYEYSGAPAEGPLFVPGEIIVRFKPGVPKEVIERINRKHGASTLKTSRRAFMRIGIPRGRSIADMVRVYSKNPNVKYAQPNSYCRAVMDPNDPRYGYQWHLDNPVYGGIKMETAWDLSTGAGVVVAVLDTGVAYDAPDLATTSFVPGWDFVNNDDDPTDDDSHGTHVTGTVAQSTNNGIGVAGVAFEASIMPVKVLDENGSGTAFDVASGLRFAADGGAEVINMSLAWPWWRGRMYNPGPVVRDAVIYAYNKGVTIVAAAGNDKKNEVAFPAAYPECIAVGATQFDEALAPYTNKGMALDLTAPGGNLKVDHNGDGYGDGVLQQTFNPMTKAPADLGYWFFEGTSMAAPHVAGVAALVIAAGATGPDNVRQVLQRTAEDHGPAGWDKEYGWGIVDAYAALESIGPPNNAPVANAAGPYSGTEDIAITFDGSGSHDPDGDTLTYTWNFGDGTTGNGESSSHIYLWGGTFPVTLTVSDGRGGADTATTTATVTEVNDQPVGDANGPYNGTVGEPVTFDGSGSYDADGDVLTYAWDFGDGSTGSSVNTTHTYNSSGTYTVTLVVSDGMVDSDLASTTATVSDTAPRVSVTSIIPESVIAGKSTGVTIYGSGFQGGASVSLEGGHGPTPEVSNVTVTDSSTITATISTRSGGPPRNRYWDVRVTNPDSSTGVLNDGFIVYPK